MGGGNLGFWFLGGLRLPCLYHFLVHLAQGFEQGLILLWAAYGNPEKVRAEVVEGSAVPDQDPPGDHLVPQFGSAEV